MTILDKIQHSLRATLLILVASLLGASGSFAATKPEITITGITPAPGSEITTFDFELQFDLSAIYAEYGYDENFGIGNGGSSSHNISLYQGTGPDGILVRTVYDFNMNGDSELFRPGDKFRFSFDDSCLLDGVTYAVVFTNIFSCRKKGETKSYGTTPEDFGKTPLVYTFTARTDADNFGMKDWSVAAGAEITHAGKIELAFTHPVEITDTEAKAQLFNYYRHEVSAGSYLTKNNLLAEGEIYVSEADPCKVILDFGDYPTYSGWEYDLKVPAGVIRGKDSGVSVAALRRRVTGSLVERFKAKTLVPGYDESGLIDSVTITWDTPQPRQNGISTTLEYSPGITLSIRGSDNTRVSLGDVVEDNWPTVTYRISGTLHPSVEYSLEGYCLGKIDATGHLPGLICDEFEGSFVAPAIGDIALALPQVKVMSHGLPELNYRDQSLPQGYVAENLTKIEVALEDYWYQDKKYTLWPTGFCQFYEINQDGDDILLANTQMKAELRGISGVTERYYAVICTIGKKLYQGKRYRLVIPENSFYQYANGASGEIFQNYIPSPEFEFIFEGGSPANVALKSVNVAEGSERESLGWVVWQFEGDAQPAEGAKAKLKMTGSSSVTSREVTTYKSGGYTYAKADFSDLATGEPRRLTAGMTYTVTLPADALVDPTDGTVRNLESAITFKGAKAASAGPEYVSLEVSVSGLHRTVHKAAKGETAAVRLGHGDWKVESLTVNGEDRTAEVSPEGEYTFSPVGDTVIEAVLAYSGEWMAEQESGVFGAEGTPLRVYSREGKIVIEGVSPADSIAVYTVGGMLVNTIVPEHDKVVVTVAPGAYIVLVNGRAARLLL